LTKLSVNQVISDRAADAGFCPAYRFRSKTV
jgi:hypothetical protein